MIKKILIGFTFFALGLSYANNLLVKVKPNSDISNIASMVDAKEFKNLGSNIYLLKFSSDRNLTIISKTLKAIDNIIYTQPDKVRSLRER